MFKFADLRTEEEKEYFLALEDGYYYFNPVENSGVFPSHHLRSLAERLDELNKPWNEYVTSQLTGIPESTSTD